MFNINDIKIRQGCYNNATLIKGMQYYKEKRVKDIDINEGTVEALVSGTKEYSVELVFAPDGSIEDFECECPAHYEYLGYCKHIVAVLHYLKDLKTEDTLEAYKQISELKSTQAAVNILGFFENRLNNLSRIPVNLEITIEIMKSPRNFREIISAVSLRIGLEKLYIVKGIKNLMEALEAGRSIDYGKRFAFDPHLHTFKEEDKSIIEFFREMYQLDKTINRYSGYGSSGSNVFNGKYFNLTHMSAVRFLKLLENRSFNIRIFEKDYENVSIIEEDLPVEFALKKSEDYLVLSVNINHQVIPITKDGTYVFLNGRVYHVSEAQQHNLSPFYNVMNGIVARDVKFNQKDGEKFASLVLPSIKKTGKLTVDSNLEELFYQKPLEAKVYLDKVDHRITADFSFFYGDYSVNPFNQNEKVGGDNIVIRDYESERKILDIIEQSGFRIKKYEVYLDEDDMIYDFIMEGIPKLQELCEVYYSNNFKGIKLYDPSYYRSSVRFNEETDLLEFSFAIDGIDKESLSQIFDSLKQKRKYYRLPDGSFLPLDSNELNSISGLVEYLDIKDHEWDKDIIDIPKFKVMYLDNKLKELDSIYVERNHAFKQMVENIKEPKDMEFAVPQSLQGIMRSYQVVGFKWLKTLAAYGLGGILADDMGLGKTLQTIAFLLSEKENKKQPSLVICPTSLVYNWESEIQKFGPSLKTLIVAGGKGEREEKIGNLQDIDVVITSYPLIRRDIEQYRDIAFDYCILDEAQHIKNPGSVNAKSVKEIRAKGYLALTGTPIENNLTELWSIFDYLMPGYLLSHRKFEERFERPIVSGENTEALKELNKHTRPFILRRLKKDVLKELPPKIESTLTVELTESQKQIYLAYLNQIKGEIEDNIRDNGFERSHIQILAGLMRLRQICCHPALFIDNYEGDSGKMELLLELLQESKESGHRVLLFSQFTQALKLIETELKAKEIEYYYLDGSTKIEARRDMVASFNTGCKDVFLISLKAGGTGLNLTGADTVIHFDPWWNPAVEDQATDRAYRIGQQNRVQVMKLITKGTIEEKITLLQQKKKELIGSVLENSESFISKMTEQDIRELFQIS